MGESVTDVQKEIEEIFRAESGRARATLIRLLGDFDRAEEALQDAFRIALEVWPNDGVPSNPRAWLISTARHKGIDFIRREKRGRELAAEQYRDVQTGPEDWDGESLEDDQLRLIFTCCHPVLSLDSRIALSLREVCGLTTEQIARAYLTSTETMKRRLSRAKKTIREEHIPYEIPSRSDLPGRIGAVLHVVYLVYNEGFAGTSGEEHSRTDLRNEGVFLARLVSKLTGEPEAEGLLALLLFHESRSKTRVDTDGLPVPLESQDRRQWDRKLIAEGMDHLQRSFMSGRIGPYTLQGAIASVHADAASVEDTNWGIIVRYYDLLLSAVPSAVVELNRAIALAMRDGAHAGLVIIDRLVSEAGLDSYHLAHAARADLLRRAGDHVAAGSAYKRAIALAPNQAQSRYLQRRLAETARKAGE